MSLLKKIAIVGAMVVGLASTAMAEDKTKVGFIYVGPTGDHGWT